MDGCNGEKSITVIYSKKSNSENNQFQPCKIKNLRLFNNIEVNQKVANVYFLIQNPWPFLEIFGVLFVI